MRMDYCPVRMDYQVVFSDNYFVGKDYNSMSKECTFMCKGYNAFTLRFFCAKNNNNVQLKTCFPSYSMVHSNETKLRIKIQKYH